MLRTSRRTDGGRRPRREARALHVRLALPGAGPLRSRRRRWPWALSAAAAGALAGGITAHVLGWLDPPDPPDALDPDEVEAVVDRPAAGRPVVPAPGVP